METGDSSKELEERLAEVDLLRRRVLNVIPHALRTPITTFRGLANALPDASEEQIRTQIVPALQRLAAQAEHLLDDMLIAAGVSTALPTGAPAPTPVVSTAEAVWTSLATDEEITFSGDTDAVVSCAPGVLFKVFVHVLDNAAKYGAAPVTVDISSKRGTVSIAINDAGTISAADAKAGFEAFYRGEAAVMAGPGLGVGLTVARALVEQAGGSMRLDHADGQTTVTVELPAA